MSTPDASNSIQEFSTDYLRIYYDRLFPYDAMYNWFSYGRSNKDPLLSSDERDFFYRREWSFTIEDDIYIRYQAFRDQSEFEAAIKKRQPHKIDIGAVFTAPPDQHNSLAPEKFKTVERELVFDIDMTDYDDIRKCCSGANICLKCWPYMTMALKVTDAALREDFGYKNILWIYSGRRGIHCWVCDPEARALSNDARDAVIHYLSLDFANDENASDERLKKPFKGKMHPSLVRAYEILEPMFEKHIADGKGQGLLGSIAGYRKLLNTLPDVNMRKELDAEFEKDPGMSGADRWARIRDKIDNIDIKGGKKSKMDPSVSNKCTEWKRELVLKHTYPKLDVNVSKHQNHLLKSPFCVHPKTGRVCVPINPTKADSFNPFEVPTVRALASQIDKYDADPANVGSEVTDTEKTDMIKALDVFEKTFLEGLRATVREEARDRQQKQSAMELNF